MTKFPWGPVVNVFEIGPYKVVEYHPEIFKNSCGTGRYEHEITNFHPYIDGQDTHRSYTTLDKALIGAICYRHDGHNTRADGYIFSMIGV